MNDPLGVPVPWVRRWAHLVPAGGRVLDLAAGGGRHARFMLARGHEVVAVDRDVSGLADIAGTARVSVVQADLETGLPWAWAAPARFAGIIVSNYLYRPTLGYLAPLLAPGGALIYQTYARGHERYGRPASADFQLEPGELIRAFATDLSIVAYEHGIEHQPAAAIQRLAAVKGEALNPL